MKLSERVDNNKEDQTMTLKETRKMDTARIRNICIKMDWYTRGTCDEYSKMFETAEREEATPEGIYEVAKDIFEHSNMDHYIRDGYSEDEIIQNVMCYIVNDATYSTIEIERA